MKKSIIFISVLLSMAYSAIWFGFAEAGTAKIEGYVTLPDGKIPAVNAEVVVQVRSVTGCEFPWLSKTCFTDEKGHYSVAMPFPDIVEIKFVASSLRANLLPFEYGLQDKGFYNVPPKNYGVYRMDIKLTKYPNAVLLQGYIRDAKSGMALPNFGMGVTVAGKPGTYALFTNSEGFYRGLITLTAIPATITVTSASFSYDLKYERKSLSATVEPYKVYKFNFDLNQVSGVGYIYGTVIDAKNGKPIQFAQVSLFGPGGWPCGKPATDANGRYRQYIDSAASYSVATLGAHTEVASRSPYNREKKVVTAGAGQSAQVDFQMIRK